MADESVTVTFTGISNFGPPAFASAGVAGIHLERCWDCKTMQHPGGDHPWWDADDVQHAMANGHRAPSGVCGCPCVTDPTMVTTAPDEPDDPDLDVSLDADPCPLCGEAGACDYDAEGRPLIHALNDGDDA